MTTKISAAEYQQFLQHYAWEVIKNPDYRFGQAFLNYFPDMKWTISATMGPVQELRLYNATDINYAKYIINQWVEHA